MDETECLAEAVERELRRQAAPKKIQANAEPYSWRVGSLGDVWLNPPPDRPSLVWQRVAGSYFPEPFDPAEEGAVASIVAEVLANLGHGR